MEPTQPVPQNAPFPFVGIGASARLWAITIVQHLEPDHEGMLGKLAGGAMPQGAANGLS